MAPRGNSSLGVPPFSFEEEKFMITKPKGCHDIYGKEGKKWQYLEQVIDALMEKYHYDYIRTPIFESSELFHRGVGESTDIVTKETYDFVDRGERNMTLRPEGTAGVVRSYLENKMYGDATQPIKLYYHGTMYRYERPQSGRDREFTQFGVEVLGSDDPMVDAEVISIPVNLFKMLGLKEIKVKINSLGDKESRDRYREALINHFKPHIDSLCDDCKARLEKNPLRILDCKVDVDNELLKTAPKTIDYLNEESKERFDKVLEYLGAMGISHEVDERLVRGLDYYNHTVFEIEAKVEGFGSQNVLAGGGRYNGLVESLGGPSTPGMGFALGMGRVLLALEKEEISLPIKEDVEAFIMYVNEEEKLNAIYLAQELRLNGFRVETEYLSRGLKGQFKQADRLNAKYLILLNSDDLKENMVTIKNNQTKEEEKIDLDYLIYYLDEHLGEEESLHFGQEGYEYHECDCEDDDCDCDDGDCNCNHHHE